MQIKRHCQISQYLCKSGLSCQPYANRVGPASGLAGSGPVDLHRILRILTQVKEAPLRGLLRFFVIFSFLAVTVRPIFLKKTASVIFLRRLDYINLVQVSVHAGTVVIVPSWPLEAGAIVMTLDITNNMQVSVTTHRVCTGGHPVQALALTFEFKGTFNLSLSLEAY